MPQGNHTDTVTEIAYSVMEKLANEPTGLINSVSQNVSNVIAVPFGTAIQSRVVGDVTVTESSSALTGTMTLPEGQSTADTVDTFALDTSYETKIALNGEEILHINNTDQPWDSLLGKYLFKFFRNTRNLVEAKVALAALKGASRAWGTAGTTPFASNYNDINGVRKIFIDNGVAEDSTWSLVMGTTAGMNLRNLAHLNQVNTSGTTETLRRGTLLDLSGFMLKESSGIQSHTAATGTGFLVNLLAGYDVGDTSIAVDTGTGTIAAGDVITFAGDDNKYVVKSATLTGSAGSVAGTIVINRPGLCQTLADGVAITKGATYTGNIALTRDAIELASRAPALPPGGDAAGPHMQISDPITGLIYDYAIYRGNLTATLALRTYVGVKVWNPFEVATLLG